MIASNEAAVRAVLPADEFQVLSVTEVRPIWDANRPVWDRTEFAAALGIEPNSFSKMKGDGLIPWNSRIGGVPSAVAMRWIENNLNEAGKKIVAELRAAG